MKRVLKVNCRPEIFSLSQWKRWTRALMAIKYVIRRTHLILQIMAPSFLLITNSAWPSEKSNARMTLPLPVHNLYPAMSRFYDPIPVSALAVYDSKPRFSLLQHYSSIFLFDELPQGHLLADMEIYTLELQADKAITENLEFGITLPVHYASGGDLDSFLRNYHDVFGLLNGGRELQPDNQYSWHYRDSDSKAVWNDDAGWELGNISLRFRRKLRMGNNQGVAALAAVKLPTASSKHGWGSGKPDLGLGGVYSWKINKWFGHLEGWYIHPFASGDPGIQYNDYGRGSTTLGWQLRARLSLLVQVQGGTSPYHSGLKQLDQNPSLLSFGFNWAMGRKSMLSLAFVENINQKTTPDFSITLGFNFFYTARQ